MSNNNPAEALGGVDIRVPTGTFGFERKVQVRDYESAVASIYVTFPVDFADEAGTMQAAKDAAFQAKSVVFEQLGVAFEYDKESGIVRELLEKQFGPVTEVKQSSQPEAVPAEPAQQAKPGGQANGPACPKCQGSMYDNRESKRSPRQPDYRCKNYKPENGGCEGVIWPPRSN